MAHYKVVLELELEADSPLEAAKEGAKWAKESELQWYVQDSELEVFSVDLSEDDEDAIAEADNYIAIIE